MLSLVDANSGHREPFAEMNARVEKFVAQKCYRSQCCRDSLICILGGGGVQGHG